MSRPIRLILAASLAILIAGGYALTRGEDGYELKLVMPSAAQLLDGSPVWIDGSTAGKVTDLEVREGKAIVTAQVSADHVPLHEGTTTRVEWHSVLGERIVTIEPGPVANPEIPSGALYEAQPMRIEVDEVLAAMDEPTRERLNSLIAGLRDTTTGRERDLADTLRTAGPAVEALGEILEAVGRDGPAIRKLITQLHEMIDPLAERQEQVRSLVANTTELTGDVARQQKQLRAGLAELPSTLRTASSTLDKLPAASRATIPLLEDLRPTTETLSSTARNLSPVLADLRPTVARLRPVLGATEHLLKYTPSLIDTGHDVVPAATETVHELAPALRFLRPYTPELAGWVTNWGQTFSGYDSQGHVWAGGVGFGPGANNESPGALPPLRVDEKPPPGHAVGQPWTDAYGSGMR